MNKTTVSDIITPSIISEWKPGELVFISAGTGEGKSHFIKHSLYDYAKEHGQRILYLINRKNTLDQFEIELQEQGKTDIIDLKTYQYFETSDLRDMVGYEYIISDESHYFFSDAGFNMTTDISFNKLIASRHELSLFMDKPPVIILMTATGKYIRGYLKKVKKIELSEYELSESRDKYGCISDLVFYHSDDSLNGIVDDILKTNDKAIVFISDRKKAYNLHVKYRDKSMFNCSAHTKEFKYVNEDKLNHILKHEKFEDQILFTTTCMDSGVNIIDREVKHIVCEIQDVMSLKQAIGRKRVQGDDDTYTLYVKHVDGRQLQGLISKNERILELAEYLRKHGTNAYVSKYARVGDTKGVIYDEAHGKENLAVKRVNEQRYYKLKIELYQAREMRQIGKYGYGSHVLRELGKSKFTVWEKGKKNLSIVEYLEKNVGRRYYKDDKGELIDKLNITDGEGKKQKSYKFFNSYFEENKLAYVILSKVDQKKVLDDGSRNPNYDKTFWEIIDDISIG